MWRGWKISLSKKSFSNIIQAVKVIQEHHRRYGKMDF
jgi:hypothetical protein